MKPFFYSFKNNTKIILNGSISSFSRGKDSRGTKGGHWTERSEGSGWSDSGTPDSLFFAKQKATLKKIQNSTFVLLNFILVLNFCFIFYKNCFCCNFNFFIVTNKHFFNIFFFHFWRNETYNWNDYQSTNHCKGTTVYRIHKF